MVFQSQIEILKSNNIKAICFATTLIIAKKMIQNGIDALILEGNEAGGHIGPVSINVLVQEILPFIKEIPVFVAGGIGRGRNNSKIYGAWCIRLSNWNKIRLRE